MFVLTEDVPVQSKPISARAAGDAVKWRPVQHTDPFRFALVVQCGHAAVSAPLSIESGDALHLEFGAGLPKISNDGLDVIVRFVPDDGEPRVLVTEVVNGDDTHPWRQRTVDLGVDDSASGVLEIECGPGPRKNPRADWLAITQCILSRPDQLSLARARMHTARRKANEIRHFSKTYKMPMFQPNAKPNAFTLAQGIVQGEILKNPVQFALRLRELAAERPVRILSLCSGAARFERGLITGIEDRVELTLTDINAELLERAAEHMGGATVKTLVGDANEIELPRASYDIVLCVSALHHIIELEHLATEIAASLVPGGEFWSIAEYVGRTGARLWEDSYAAADAIFVQLPERLRTNHVQGKPRIDDHLMNVDCSLNTFEGVRSEDILSVLSEHFEPFHVDRWSTIIWRVFGPAYNQNYDPDHVVDRALIEHIARLDVGFQQRGELQPVAMKGVFKRR